MLRATRLLLGGALLLSACGGSDPAPVPGEAFAGSLSISSAMPAGTTSCLTTTRVTFTAAGVDDQSVVLAGGGCLEFFNADAAPHRPTGSGTAACTELNGPTLAKDGSFLTVPLDGPRACLWVDALNRPSPGGGGGGH